MKGFQRSLVVVALAAASLGAGVQPAVARKAPLLFGTTGACNNVLKNGPCTQTSTLVQLDPDTGALIRVIGPVGFTVNGLAWDRKSKRLYASTAIGDVVFHGLITIDPSTGAGTPVNGAAVNFGLAGAASPVHSLTIDSKGHMVAWYDEVPPPANVTDTFVTIDQRTGVATEFPNTGINTSQNGLSFDERDRLWNIDATRIDTPGAPLTQTAYRLDPASGHVVRAVPLTPPLDAALGDFNPENGLYYGLDFEAFSPAFPTVIQMVDLRTGAVTTLGRTVDGLHTLAFAKKDK
ncbi:MAG: hypothetical protein RJA49_1439 [Actinomycetota bacterium]